MPSQYKQNLFWSCLRLIIFSELLRGREITIQEMRQEKKIEERQRKFEEERMRLPKLEGYDYDLMWRYKGLKNKPLK